MNDEIRAIIEGIDFGGDAETRDALVGAIVNAITGYRNEYAEKAAEAARELIEVEQELAACKIELGRIEAESRIDVELSASPELEGVDFG